MYEQAFATFSRVQGSSSMNVAAYKKNLGSVYFKKANKAVDVKDLDRYMFLAITHYREAARIYTAINRMDKAKANEAERMVTHIVNKSRQLPIFFSWFFRAAIFVS